MQLSPVQNEVLMMVELVERVLVWPDALFDRLCQGQQYKALMTPSAVEGKHEECSTDTTRLLSNVVHVVRKSKVFRLSLRDIRLKQNVGLCLRGVDAAINITGNNFPSQCDLSVQVIDQLGGELGLNRLLLSHSGQIMTEPILCCADHADTSIFELRTTSTTKDLQHIEDAQIDKLTLLGAVNLRSLDDDRSCGQVNTPGQSSGTAKDFQNTFSE
ncbi:hypothetical protein HG530_010262 [Fusarium avenaceum]|nr:hypothetical protein HG530_010262 [Fusarium avenaceum]